MLVRVPAIASAIALILTPLWLFATNPAIPRSHPLLPSLLIAAAVLGLVIAGTCWRAWRRPRRADKPLPRRRRAVLQSVAALLAIGLMAALTWLAPFPLRGEDGGPTDALALVNVDLTEDATSITLTPAGGVTRGLVFYPGARVEALAYVPILARIAEEGTLVIVLKEPLGISLVQSGQAATGLEDHPEISTWAVGGHSLGGVSASIFASDNDVDGLLLWASYPLDDLSASDLAVLSVSGSEDGLTTPGDVDVSRDLLPAGTRFTEIDGGIHAFFSNYGEQPGDGNPLTSRETAQDGIVRATTEFLAALG